MAAVLYRCPNTGLYVQRWFAHDVSPTEGDINETIICTACRQIHLVCPATGKVLLVNGE